MKLVVASKADLVSTAIGRMLIENYGFKPIGKDLHQKGEVLLKFIEEKHIYANGLGEDLSPDLMIIVSSHRSEAGVKALLAHPVGNWGLDVSMGGLPRTLSPTSAAALYKALHSLQECASNLGVDGWKIGLEVTHHGPATDVPTIFMEAGGPPDEIPEARVLEVIASACMRVLKPFTRVPPAATGFGGGHYAPRFTRLALNKEYSFGHMCPKYAMPVGRELIVQAFQKTLEAPRIAVLDWKGLRGKDRELIISVLEDLGIEWVKA